MWQPVPSAFTPRAYADLAALTGGAPPECSLWMSSDSTPSGHSDAAGPLRTRAGVCRVDMGAGPPEASGCLLALLLGSTHEQTDALFSLLGQFDLDCLIGGLSCYFQAKASSLMKLPSSPSDG